MRRVRLGCEQLLEDEAGLIRGRRVGLITNASGVDGRLVATADRLHQSRLCEVAALFAPEHGIRGAAEDGERVDTFRDPRTGIVVHSLYGERRAPDADMLAGVELVLFDIQDVGARFYTYLYTMSLSMEACARHGIPFAVLDRPNPIGGLRLAGNVLDPAFASFVGRHPIPIRYGLTIGELAALFNAEYGLGAELHVVRMQGWRRRMYWEETGLPWVPPSPNMPAVATAVAYPGTCFFEGTNISEGRGTSLPFEQFGAPFVDGARLAAELSALALEGALWRPVFFRPCASKHAGQLCQGVQLHVVDRERFDPVRSGFAALVAVRRLCERDFAWRVPAGGIHNFDRLAGSARVRQAIDAGASADELVASWQGELEAFAAVRQRYLLYE